MTDKATAAEGSLKAPERHPLGWREDEFWDEGALTKEMARIFDICHGCRRCFPLCNAFPTLFDLIDESETLEIDGVDLKDYPKVVEHCYLCDLCFMTKCPYVPPHPWNVDFPRLMLRAKAQGYQKRKPKWGQRLLTSPDKLGRWSTLPIVVHAVNAANRSQAVAPVRERLLGVHRDAKAPGYHNKPLHKRVELHESEGECIPAGDTTGKVALFATCYCNYNEPDIGEDLAAVFRHNDIAVRAIPKERCCGMPKLEIGDLDAVARLKEMNIPRLAALVDDGFDLTAPVPSCVLMFKQELPGMFPEDESVEKVRKAFYDPFEYLSLRHKAGKLNTDFKQTLGTLSYHLACHQRVQNIGARTRDVLSLIPDTEITPVERCSGHDGTYGVRKDTYEMAKKLAKPVVKRMEKNDPDHITSDCPLAARHLANNMEADRKPSHPVSLLRYAYGI